VQGRHAAHGTAPVTRDATSVGGLRQGAGGLLALGVLAALAFIGWTVAAPGPPVAPAAGGASDDPAVVQAGRGLYTANCASCHGSAGQGGAYGPSLEHAGAAAADFYLRTGRMPLSGPNQRVVRQPPVFDEAQIEALVAYVASLGDGPAIPQVVAGGDLRHGRELYTANCAACHAVTGAGNAIGGGYVAVGLGFADPTTVAEAVTIGPGAMPRFGFDAQAQADLAAYIDWLRAEPSPGGLPIGGTGPVAEGFIGVAIGLPFLLLVTLFVARHRRDERPRSPGDLGPAAAAADATTTDGDPAAAGPPEARP
jgi:ubiquinol-cytochrome c reductase cytochrome c subunit